MKTKENKKDEDFNSSILKTFNYISSNVIALMHKDVKIIISANGTKRWFANGVVHNENGPAIICPTGEKYWWLDNRRYTEKEWKSKIEKRRK